VHERAWCEVDLDAVRHNLARLRAAAGVPLIPMVKADAYGLGADAIVRLCAQFTDHEAPWALGVATVDEGTDVRTSGWTGRILCCSPVLPSEHARMYEERITPALHTEADILSWRRLGEQPWHLSIDTGMNRAGVAWNEAHTLADVVSFHPPEGVFTHLHSAGENESSRVRQEQRFTDALHTLALPASTLRHAANSPALAADAERGARPNWDLARPGIALYGSPSSSALQLLPVLHVFARVVDVRHVATGETVSYDATWTAPRESRIATVAIGHGDGYRRALSNRGIMQLHGQAVPVVGVVTMDMTMLDVTSVPCEVGDVVTVLGAPHERRPADAAEPLTIDALAELAQLSPYELLVGWRLRLPRVYRSAT
jgi:alanine racemase